MFTPISELDNNRTSWILKLMAICVYFVPRWARVGDYMEIVFHDEHGTRIHAHLNRPEKKKFENQITEDGVYAIRNVHVLNNYQSLKTTANDKLLGFFRDTKVKTLNRSDFPRIMFDLKRFPVLQSQPCLNDQVLIVSVEERENQFHEEAITYLPMVKKRC
ncbi:unnamed protein product [Cuscuta campestris]|uniref:Replication protein A 70 kDa DNA-binding subunit B/D first OB fold domain-containing protein n=1 Tax=Cuscuta campestris TaxID=132261 RepID=A0A484L3E7_9ASTE|nr:unnamed protein product [Cuscuta campestris]